MCVLQNSKSLNKLKGFIKLQSGSRSSSLVKEDGAVGSWWALEFYIRLQSDASNGIHDIFVEILLMSSLGITKHKK